MKKLLAGFGVLSLILAGVSVVQAGPIELDTTLSCNDGNAINGIAIGDVTGNMGGSTNCWGTFDGNDTGPSGDGYTMGTMEFQFLAKDDGALEGAAIGLTVNTLDDTSGTWSFNDFDPTAFLIVLKASSEPGFAVWLFDGDAADSTSGAWSVSWLNKGGQTPGLSHLSIYEKVPEPSTLILLGTGLAMVGLRVRRKKR